MTAPRTVTLTLATDVAQAVYELAHEWKAVESYGHFPGGDPRDFTPDPDSSLEAERAAHKAACDAWDRGEREPVEGAHREQVKDGTLVVSHCQVFGLGSYVMRAPLLAAFCAEMERAAKAPADDLERALAASEESNFAATQAMLDAEKARAEATALRAQLDELKRALHVHLWQVETWGGAHATEAALRILVPQDYAPIANDATETMLDAFAARHPEDVEKIRAVIRVANGGGSPAECRVVAGLTVRMAAKVAGVPVERIEAIEQGAEATTEEFAKLTTAYDVPGWAR